MLTSTIRLLTGRTDEAAAWDALIRGALIWGGAGDPLAGCDRIREEADTDLDALRQALGAATTG